MKDRGLTLSILFLFLLSSQIFAQDSLVVSLASKSLNLWDTPVSFKYDNGYGYLVDQAFGLCKIDMLNLENLEETERSDIFLEMANYSSINIFENHVIVTAGPEGLLIFDQNDLSENPDQMLFDDITYAGSMLIHDNYGYLGSSDNLFILDFSDINSPAIVNTLENVVSGRKYIEGDYLYSLNNDGLTIFDISNPTSPVPLGFSARPELNGMWPDEKDLVVDQGYAYVIGKMFGVEYAWLRVVDISDPENPQNITSLVNQDELLNVSPENIHLYNNQLIITGLDGVSVYEIEAPGVIGERFIWNEDLNLIGGKINSFITDDYLIYFADNSGLSVFDITDTENPLISSSFNRKGNLVKVKSEGFFSYLLNYNFGNPELYIYNNMTPENPVLMTTVSFESGSIADFDVRNNYLYINRDYAPPQLGTFEIYDMLTPQDPTYVGGYVSNYDCREILVDDEIAVVCHSEPGQFMHAHYWVDIVDISNPQNPHYIDRTETGLNYTKPLLIQNDYLYMSIGGDINSYDLADGTLADIYSSYRVPENVEPVSITNWEDHFYLLSPQDPSEILILEIFEGYVNLVETWNLDEEIQKIYIDAGNIFLTTETGIDIYSIEQPLDPELLTTAEIPGTINDLYVSQDILYTAERYFYGVYELNGYTDVEEISLAKPANFQLLPAYPNPFNPSVTIPFTLDQNSIINIKAYDILGREAGVILNKNLNAGYHRINWDTSTGNLASGTYFIRVENQGQAKTQRIQLMK